MPTIDPPKLSEFQQAYVAAALWSSTDDDGQPLDKRFGIADIDAATLAGMLADCDKFTADNANAIAGAIGAAGHDFWLTRNGHGAGFWDGDWEKGKGKWLTIAAKSFPSVDLYVGDDGKVHA